MHALYMFAQLLDLYLVRNVRASYIAFGSDYSNSTIFGIYVSETIFFDRHQDG